MQCNDHASCREYFHEIYGCAICLIECPYSQAGYEKIKSLFKGNSEAPQFRIPLSIDVELEQIAVIPKQPKLEMPVV